MKRRRDEVDMESEVESTRKRLCQVETKRIAIMDGVYQLDNEIKSLQAKRQKMIHDGFGLTQGLLADAFKAYSQASTLALTAKLQSYLPRELRDMIYLYLLDDVAYDLVELLDSCATSGPTYDCPGQPCCCLDECDMPLPYAVDEAYVGQPTALEVVETFYREITTETGESPFTARGLVTANHFISHDIFQVGLDPTTAIRNLIIRLPLRSSLLQPKGTPWGKILKERLEPLKKVVNKTGFWLTIELIQVNIVKLNLLDDIIPLLRPVLQPFIDADAIVHIDYIYKYGSTSRPFSEMNETIFDWDLEKAIKQPESDWKAELIEFINDHTDVRMFAGSRLGHIEDPADHQSPTSDGDRYFDDRSDSDTSRDEFEDDSDDDFEADFWDDSEDESQLARTTFMPWWYLTQDVNATHAY